MSFSFGNTGSGNPPSTQGSGFSFGNPGAAGTGFSFAAKPTTQTTATTTTGFSLTGNQSSFSFSSTKQTGGGFAFGNPATGATQQPSQTPSFGFAAQPQIAKPTLGFGATTTAPSAKGSFGFGGGAAATTAATGFGFGTNPPTASQTPGFGFGMSNTNAAASTISSTPAFGSSLQNTGKPSFGAPASTASAFNLAPQSVASTKPLGFGLGPATQSTGQTSAVGFNFNTPVAQSSAQSGDISLNQASSAAQSLFPTNKTTASNPPAFGSTLTGLLTAQKPAPTATSIMATKSDSGTGFQLSTSTSSTGSAFSMPTYKLPTTASATSSSSTGFQLQSTTTSSGFPFGSAPQSTATTLMPSAGKFSLYQPADSAPTAQPEMPAQRRLASGTTTSQLQGSTSAPPVQSSFLPTQSTSTIAPTTALKTSSSFSFGVPAGATITASPATTVPGSKSAESQSLGFTLPTAATAVARTTALSSTLGTGLGSTLTTTAASSAPALKYKELESKINKWKGDLEQQEHLFITQATQVNAWSKLLIGNAEKITTLNDEFEKVTCDQERLNQELDFIKTQQDELEELLLPLEEATTKQMSSMTLSVHTHHADVEREQTYNLAETIDGQLKRMSEDLREVIEHVNASSASGDTATPVSQISKILSAHMDSLQWLDTNSGTLQQKLDQLTKQVNERKIEQENRLRLAFD